MAKPPLTFTFYIAAPVEKVWDGFVSKEANRTIFMGADFEVDLKPGGTMSWSGPGKDGTPTRYVTGEVVRAEAPTLLEYRFGIGEGAELQAPLARVVIGGLMTSTVITLVFVPAMYTLFEEGLSGIFKKHKPADAAH